MDAEQLGRQLLAARVKLGLSYDEVSRRTGYLVSSDSVRFYETGKVYPRKVLVAAMFRALGIEETT